jgi:eukaryotic-like serine/threonine-protein kinase
MIEALPGDIFHRGQVLNNTYEIEGVLGRGGTGEVYRAKNLISGRVVAIKALNAQFSGQEGYIELMKREEQMRDIRDDAVVRYTECSRMDQGHVFLVMDFIDGPSIADEMLKRRLEPRELMIIAHRVAEGLVAAHGQGIVHRDLSPDNVILRGGNPEKATIIDFGIAKDTAAGARTIVGNDFAGKYEYAAPEQMEGRAEARSDLYALGALLLAAWKGQVPFAGMTPGEMIRRKSQPLDTAGVPEPLKGLIDWLSAPDLKARAPSAAAVVEQLGKVLKGPTPERRGTQPPTRVDTRGPASSQPARKGGGGLIALLLLVLLAAGGGGAWYAGLLDQFLKEQLPIAAPYSLEAAQTSTLVGAKLQANAPDEAGAATLTAAFKVATGSEPAPEAITLAQGMPSPEWLKGAAAVFAAAKGLEEWKITLSDMTANVTGIAPTRAEGDKIRAALADWASLHGFTLKGKVANGPKILMPDVVQAEVDKFASCGPLLQVNPPQEGYVLEQPIRLRGFAMEADLDVALKAALSDIVGDREVMPELVPLTEELCRVRGVLPPLPNNSLSIWFGQGATGESNLTGIFRTGDQVLIDVLMPATITDGHLWVIAVDANNTVFNILPNARNGETDITKLSVIENGVRRIRVVHGDKDRLADKTRIGMIVTDTDYGKSEIYAFLSEEPLYDVRRPGDESIDSLLQGLAEIEGGLEDKVIGFAARLLESRP